MPKDTKRSPSNNHGTPGASQSLSQSQQQGENRFWTSERAQTSIDLLLAITIFFGAVALLTITSPDIFFPDGISATDDTTDADRIAIELTNANLTQPGVTGIAHENVTAFLSASGSLHEQFGLEDGKQVNVTISTTSTTDPPTALDPTEVSYPVQTSASEHFANRGPEIDGARSTVTRETTLNERQITITVTVFRP
jgi:hypothetical protein